MQDNENIVVPVHYGLNIELDSEKDRYDGKVEIELNFKGGVSEFVLNSEGLNIRDVSFNGRPASFRLGGDELTITDFEVLEQKNVLGVLFDADVNTKMVDFYVSRYGTNKKMYSTHFEPIEARKAFPCFDHPEMKATFDIEITASKNFTILSSMGTKTERVEDVKKTVIFNRMKRTSTYLIAFVIGDLQKITSGRVSLYSTYDANQGLYALKVADLIMQFFEEYFDIKYPLEKLDLVGIPEFTAGAMENWGLVTFREAV